MSHVASLRLCTELYELTKESWHDHVDAIWYVSRRSNRRDIELIVNQVEPKALVWKDFVDEPGYTEANAEDYEIYPAYDLGYLLRKLPLSRRKEVGTGKLHWKHYYLSVIAGHSTGSWVASFRAVTVGDTNINTLAAPMLTPLRMPSANSLSNSSSDVLPRRVPGDEVDTSVSYPVDERHWEVLHEAVVAANLKPDALNLRVHEQPIFDRVC